MPSYYAYLISSLPMLHFEAGPPFSFEKFLEICKDLVSESDLDAIKTTAPLKTWHAFDKALRNELVKIRAARKHINPSKYLRGDGYADPSITHIALSAHRSPSILEGEEMLDRERWRVLDELAAGHYFDLNFLIIYGIKLLILKRWEEIRAADGAEKLENALAINKPRPFWGDNNREKNPNQKGGVNSLI